ncbi:MAG: B-box zinc finger protein [Firmicutes bacterium]|nr:B-box zinc finger protein [Bacillota bacterium]
MRCANHPEVEAQALCAICNAPVCSECRVELRNKKYCRPCLEDKTKGVLDGTVTGHKNTGLAFLFSLIPGAGYMYLGLMNRGLQVMVIFFGTLTVVWVTGLEVLVPLVLPVLLFYNIFDTLQLAGRMRRGVPVEDKPLVDPGGKANWPTLLGYALIGVGALVLLNNYVPQALGYWFMERLITPLLIIALGLFILYRNIRRGKKDDNQGHV